MRDKPILFSAPMVRALFDGRKTQTRRALNPQPAEGARFAGIEPDGSWMFCKGCFYGKIKPRYTPGDRLYVREAWRTWAEYDDLAPRDLPTETLIGFVAGGEPKFMPPGKFRQGIHMPRWASRLTLTVTDVRVERLQEISEADAKAEGALLPWTGSAGTACDDTRTALSEFQALWDGINSDRNDGAFAWSANPWIVAVFFTVEHRNIDQVA